MKAPQPDLNIFVYVLNYLHSDTVSPTDCHDSTLPKVGT